MDAPIGEVTEADCLDAMAAMPAESVDCVVCDPPYGMAFRSNMRIERERFDTIENDEGFDPVWQLAWMRAAFRVLRPDRHFYAFCSDHHLGDFRATAAEAGFNVKRTLVWVKDAGTMGDLGGDYQHKTEFVVFGHKGRRDLLQGRPPNVIEARRVPPGQMQHPTEKPVRVLRPLVLNSTHPGEVILDPFAGSGSTGVVAQEEGRGFVLIEQVPAYVQIARERLAQGGLF